MILEQQKTHLLKAEEIAVMLGLKVQTVYAMARRGELQKVNSPGDVFGSVPVMSSG